MITSIVISNLLDIYFIHSDIHNWVRKKYILNLQLPKSLHEIFIVITVPANGLAP